MNAHILRPGKNGSSSNRRMHLARRCRSIAEAGPFETTFLLKAWIMRQLGNAHFAVGTVRKEILLNRGFAIFHS
jgi:hypothetical protein